MDNIDSTNDGNEDLEREPQQVPYERQEDPDGSEENQQKIVIPEAEEPRFNLEDDNEAEV